MTTFYGVKRKTGRVDPPDRLPSPRSAAATQSAPPAELLEDPPELHTELAPVEQLPVEPGPVAQALAHVLDHQADEQATPSNEERGSGATQL